MRRLALYPMPPRQAIENVESLDVTPECTRCTLHKTAKTVCIPPEGKPGGVLVLGDSSSLKDEQLRRPMAGEAGQYVRRLIRNAWAGPVAYDNAIRCYPKGKDLRETHFKGCAPYTAQTINEVQPQRILLMGAQAAFALTGRKLSPLSVRRGYGFLSDGTPYFLLMSPGAAMRNRFMQRWFESDLAWALTVDLAMLDSKREETWSREAHIVESAEDARLAYETLRGADAITFDAETSGALYETDGLDDEPAFSVRCMSVTAQDSEESFVWGDEAIKNPLALAWLKLLLEEPDLPKIGQNVKYDMHAALCGFYIVPVNVVYDTRLLRKLDFAEADADLEAMQELVGMGGGKDDAHAETDRIIKTARSKRSTPEQLAALGDPELVMAIRRAEDKSDAMRYVFGLTAPDITYRYCAIDTLSTGRVASSMVEQIRMTGQLAPKGVWWDLIQPAIAAVHQVESWGIPVSRRMIDNFDTLLGLQLQEVEAGLRAALQTVYDKRAAKQGTPQETVLLGRSTDYSKRNPLPSNTRLINLDSPPQLAEILFDHLKLKPPPDTKTGSGAQSTSADVLEAMESQHPICAMLIARRRITKIQGTYARGLRPYIRSDGRIHCTIHLDGARSGRTSSSGPNLQNIPRADTEIGKLCRSVFVAPDGWEFWEFDYSQIELRIAALLSGDPLMLEIFLSGEDYHLRTAKMICVSMGVPLSDLEYNGPDAEALMLGKHHPLRTKAKSVNFGILYGQGPGALAANIGTSYKEAEKIMKLIMGKFKVLAAWCKKQVELAQKTGAVWTWWDGNKRYRKRDMVAVAAKDSYERSVAEHGCWNTPIQGTASEFLIHLLVKVVNWIKRNKIKAQVCMPIHDSLLMLVHKSARKQVSDFVPKAGASFNSGPVPMVMDAKAGDTWSEMMKVKLPLVA